VLAQAAGLPDEQVEALVKGCLVHDLGKIGISDHILRKQAGLTYEETARMRMHPMIGFHMLRHLPWPQEVLDVVLHHHERWDGTGYPSGLEGQQIPAPARLVAIADALDAMVSDRPYRPAGDFESAAAEIQRGAGIQFDPELVAAFVRAWPQLRATVRDLQAELGTRAEMGPRLEPVAT
jgi:HD-GYP domain-containing protein (c-di-GMP phosphodiesterase class II)